MEVVFCFFLLFLSRNLQLNDGFKTILKVSNWWQNEMRESCEKLWLTECFVCDCNNKNAQNESPWKRRVGKLKIIKNWKQRARLSVPINSNPMCIILRKVNHHWLLWILSALVINGTVAGNPDAKRLYDDLLSNYNKLVRPVVNTSDASIPRYSIWEAL